MLQKNSAYSGTLPFVVLVILASVVILGGIVFSQKSLMGQEFTIQGREHIADGATHSAYNSNPPTSGWHYAQDAEWGVYQTELPDEQLVHNLEHGGIWISYKSLDAETKAELEAIGKSTTKVIVEPRAKNDTTIALASWGRLLKLSAFDAEKIREFIATNKNNAPESLVN